MAADTLKTVQALVDALTDLRKMCANHPVLQARDYIDLGIQSNNALDAGRALIAQMQRDAVQPASRPLMHPWNHANIAAPHPEAQALDSQLQQPSARTGHIRSVPGGAAFLRVAAQSSKAALSDEEIDAVFSANHNPQDEHWANWRRFARAILARAGITRKPMPLKDRRPAISSYEQGWQEGYDVGVREAEQFHGITPQAGKESGE